MARFTVGLTGGIASGKSAAADRFAALGIEVVDADVAAREVVAPGSVGLPKLVDAFGADILDSTGALDRRRMRERVFNDPDARRQLEAMVHPLVREAVHARAMAATSAYTVVAIPLLTEGGGRAGYPWMDRILVIDVDPALQRERVVRRDAIEAALAVRMIAAQATRAQRFAVADDIVVNDGTLDALNAQVDALDRRYRRLALAVQSSADN